MASTTSPRAVSPSERDHRCQCGGHVVVYRAGPSRPACLSCLACGRVRFEWLAGGR